VSDGAQDKTSLYELIRKARREKGLTQSELARLAGCGQSAISMFEGGQSAALSRKSLLAIGEKLGLDPGVMAAADSRTPAWGDTKMKYCPSCRCPSNVPYMTGEGLCFKPAMMRALAGVKTWCSWCGELMEESCPNEQCGADVTEGAFCECCGFRYVAVSGDCVSKKSMTDEWADGQRRRIRELIELSGTRNSVR